MTPPIKPGPAAAAIASIWPSLTPALASARLINPSMISTCARAAISGTTPPYAACSAIWLTTSFDRLSPPPCGLNRTTAAAVSSQVVSMPRTSILLLRAGDIRLRPPTTLNAIVALTVEANERRDMKARLRLGTRGSPLALVQAGIVRARLAATHGLAESDIDVVVIKTSGDAIQDRALAQAGGKGLFTKELDSALVEAAIDLAVHSAKDLPTLLPDAITIAGYLAREDARDVLIARQAGALADLPQGAVVGSASLRREALGRRLRPDLRGVLLRGNLDTRLPNV